MAVSFVSGLAGLVAAVLFVAVPTPGQPAVQAPRPAPLEPPSPTLAVPGSGPTEPEPTASQPDPSTPGSETAAAEPTPSTPAATEPDSSKPGAVEPTPVDGPVAAHAVLPCGLRVVALSDRSLPVAAVVLAVDTGTRDDPENYPGLVSALAYHLHQGNRELRPGAALGAAHDSGGVASMAIGAAQVRFESLVPASALDRVLWVESQRLRAPTVNPNLWVKSINYAKRDRGKAPIVSHPAWAAAWQDPGLGHNGRRIGGSRARKLAGMIDRQISAQLARLFVYQRATLVVVSPDDPATMIDRVRPLFSDLPPAARQDKKPVLTEQNVPRSVEQKRAKGDTLVWAVPGRPGAALWAKVLCDTLNRQRRRKSEPKTLRVRCAVGSDPQRGIVLVRATGTDDAVAAIQARLARIEQGKDGRLLERRRKKRVRRLNYRLAAPRELAVHVAAIQAPEAGPGTMVVDAGAEDTDLVAAARLTGQERLSTRELLIATAPKLLDVNYAVRLVAPAGKS